MAGLVADRARPDLGAVIGVQPARFPKQGILQDLTFHLPMADWNNGCVAYMPDAHEINANQMTSAMCAVTPFAKAFRAFGETADAELSSDNPTGVGRGTQGIKTKPQRLTIAFEATDIAGDKTDRKMEVKMMCTKFGLTKGQRFEKSDPASGLKRGTDYYFCSFNAGPGA